MSEKKTQKSYIDFGFGFPVQILNAPLKKVRGAWNLDLNMNVYEKAVLVALSQKSTRLTGFEVRFIRHYLEMTLKEFGQRFGDVAHSAVIKWEKFADEPTNMNWACEKDIRLALINSLRPKLLRITSSNLETTAPRRPARLKIDSSDFAA